MPQLLDYWPVAVTIAQALMLWAAWSLRQMAKNEIDKEAGERRGRDEELQARLDGHENRITKAEGRMDELIRDVEQLPTKADLARVEGEVRGVGNSVAAANEGIRRIEGYFIERGVRA